MASHRQMQALASDAVRVRDLAKALLASAGAEWTDWEIDFLESMTQHEGAEPLTMRQREVLSELQEQSKIYSSLDGFSVPALIKECWLSRLDLPEADEAFVTGTFAGIAPVTEVDGRRLTAARGPMVERLQRLYLELIERDTAQAGS